MKAQQMIRKGDRIFFKPEWQDKGDDSVTFIAQSDESNGQVEVVAMLGLPINPWNYASVDMIERVEPCA